MYYKIIIKLVIKVYSPYISDPIPIVPPLPLPDDPWPGKRPPPGFPGSFFGRTLAPVIELRHCLVIFNG